MDEFLRIMRGVKMDKVKKAKIRCSNPSCKKWFNASFNSTTIKSIKVQCTHCGRMTEYIIEDNKINAEDAGISGNNTI